MSSGAAPFAHRIVTWQRRHGRHDLPWQNTRDAYRIWLSEIMLQQTQVSTVLPYYERFVAAYPDVAALAAASIDRVLQLWSGLGYYRRAHHLHAAACEVVERHGGSFPTDAATLQSLPGIGRSTAAAIAAFSSGERAAILDGNVKRVLARHRGIDGYPGSPEVQTRLWSAADALLPPSRDIASYTQGLMDLGATLCLRRNPQCEACPVSEDCVARREGRIHSLPAPRPVRVRPERAVRLLIIEHSGTILLERRPPTGVWSGLWSLPEVKLDEDVRVAMKTKFALDVQAGEAMPVLRHEFTHFALTMHPQLVRVARVADVCAQQETIWLAPDDAIAAALPSPIRKLLRALRTDDQRGTPTAHKRRSADKRASAS
ncbi:MAG TPA: A/G-specific adenine glycosylase [Casimicrobiaceae bacterium]|nr:A/G-specific adenine glycosylase [Casimicrobiaceae bacterium]